MCANGADVTVSPEDMQGWVIVTNQGAGAELAARGPVVYEREKPFIAEDGNDLVRITGTVVDRNAAMFALDDGSGCVIRGFLYKDIQTPQNRAKLGERWSVWGHLEKVPFQPAEGPPLIWTCPGHMTKL